MSRPTLTAVTNWRTEDLGRLADAWEVAGRTLSDRVAAADSVPTAAWTGAAADVARADLRRWCAEADAIAVALALAAAAARDGAAQLAEARDGVVTLAATARSEGFDVADDGVVRVVADPPALLRLLSGGDGAVAATLQRRRADELTAELTAGLDRLAAADADAAADITEALHRSAPAGDGPWGARIAQNRVLVAQAVLDAAPGERLDLYRELLAEISDPAGGADRVDRQILQFDPEREILVELHGDLTSADHVAVLIPGMNTTIEGSAAHAETARGFVTATGGEVATITYLGGEFPHAAHLPVAVLRAADPRYALRMAPGLASFSGRLDRELAAGGRDVDVTYIGHSYGGAILGAAEVMGLTADRTVYVAAAGSGFGVDDPSDWHNGNPDVVRYSMTAPGDPIQLVQELAPHGVDPDTMPGVIRLEAGRYDDGRPMAGLDAHSDVLDTEASDAWRTVLAVITGER